MKKTLTIAIPSLFLLSASHIALAANPETVSVNVTFVDAIAINEVNPLSFGLLDSSMADSQTLVISPEDTLTDSNNNKLGGTAEAAEVTVTATAGQSISISVDNITSGSYYTLSNPTCKYVSNAAASCTSQTQTSVASGQLLIGMTLTKNSTTATAGEDNGSFDVNVIYN